MKPWSDLRIILHQDKAMSCCPLTTVHECTYRMIAWKSAAIFRIIPLSNFHGSCHRLQDKICLQDFVMLCLYVYLYIYTIRCIHIHIQKIYIYTYMKNHFYTENADSPRHVFTNGLTLVQFHSSLKPSDCHWSWVNRSENTALLAFSSNFTPRTTSSLSLIWWIYSDLFALQGRHFWDMSVAE